MNLRETLINKNLPVHEQLIFCLLLTMVGGFFDAYTFVNCNGIFANAQTGNLIFVGIDLIEGNFREVLHYSIPILSFVVGVLVSKCIETKYKELSIFKHIYILLLIQIFVLFVIGAAAYGSLTADKKIILKQGGAAILALISIFLFK